MWLLRKGPWDGPLDAPRRAAPGEARRRSRGYSAKGSTQPLATLATLAGRALAGAGLPPVAAPSNGVRRASGRPAACLTGFGAGAASSAMGAAAAGAGTAAALA